MNAVVERVRREPVLVLAAVQAGIVCGVAFGLHLDTNQQAAILGLSGALLALVARSRVTPVASSSMPENAPQEAAQAPETVQDNGSGD